VREANLCSNLAEGEAIVSQIDDLCRNRGMCLVGAHLQTPINDDVSLFTVFVLRSKKVMPFNELLSDVVFSPLTLASFENDIGGH
jgi:hypothetical protein